MAAEQHAELYFDVISPFAYLLDALLRRAPLAIPIAPKPVLFAGLLQAHGNKGPAEIERKRLFTYEYCTWFAQSQAIAFQMPAAHPFNPLRLLRLIIALDNTPAVISTVFDALYTTGADPGDPALWQALTRELGLSPAEADELINQAHVKAKLRANTQTAAAAGVFGVPTLVIGERLFWGVDALPMAVDYLAGGAAFSSPAMQAARAVRVGAQRRL